MLSVVVTVLATVVAALLLWGLVMGVRELNRIFGTGTWNGWELEIKEDGTRVGRQWRRSNRFTSFFRGNAMKLTKESEQERVTERSRLLGQ
ncbi:domain found in Plexins, Semaphorins and Integrins [Teratosphaeria destructans]|uniref:Domain found in Plexins, Semaphorins and Integrins n=1 Tax=Teratosphaeria destructans TaxID=418781 RepID=A0A9W7VZI0_9PEZI|nr:domain found in Plexins, Semaphorins and Integrins [Teratosphaeria destructans]